MQIDLSVFIFAPNLGNSDNAKIFPVQPHLFYAKRDIPSFFGKDLTTNQYHVINL